MYKSSAGAKSNSRFSISCSAHLLMLSSGYKVNYNNSEDLISAFGITRGLVMHKNNQLARFKLTTKLRSNFFNSSRKRCLLSGGSRGLRFGLTRARIFSSFTTDFVPSLSLSR
jgi:hypothetical protein